MNLEKYMELDIDKKLEYFLETLSMTNRTYKYFVNWEKVEDNMKKYEIELNTMNYLIGKENIYEETVHLFEKYPELIKLIPILLAIRESRIDILNTEEITEISNYNFEKIDKKNIKSYVDFMKKTNLLEFLKSKAKKSLVDYVYGVEVGLDSNGRKNRSGTIMENIVENKISEISQILNLEYEIQVTASMINKKWGIKVPVDKSKRKFDIAVYNKNLNKLWVIETNYYGGGGSKLKSVAHEFSKLSKFVSTSENNVEFLWITDGQGWNTAKIPLSEAFEVVKNIFNLNMLDKGYLKEIFKKNI